MKVIPAMDLMNGQLVRLYKGQFDQIRSYDFTPQDYAKRLLEAGFERLHLVDLEGARSGSFTECKLLKELSAMGFQVDVGGGLRNSESVDKAFSNGASQINIGTAWFKEPELMDRWLGFYGADRMILGMDIREGKPAISGWQTDIDLGWEDVLEDALSRGIQYVSCTSITRDGTGTGPDAELYQKITQRFPELKLIASGGVGNIRNLSTLNDIPLEGVIVGKALMEEGVNLKAFALC